jgi:carboxypeptidase T
VKNTCLLLIVVSLVCLPLPAGAEWMEQRIFTRIDAANLSDREVVSNLGFAIDYVDLDEGYVEAWVPASVLPRLEKLGLTYTAFPDVLYGAMPPAYAAYHDYPEQRAFLNELATQRPEITDLFVIGQTLEDRDIVCLKISSDPMQDQLEKPATMIVAMHHAREILTPEMALRIAQELVEGYGVNEQLTHYVDEHEIFIVPNLNPDGGEFDHQGGTFRMWRKNRRVNDGSQCRGVDLNRNYGYKWGGAGSSGFPCDETYRGTEGFSEPETAAFRDLVLAHENVTTILSLHSFSKLVLYPWGHTYQHIQDETAYNTFKKLAEYMAKETGFRDQQASALYPTSGDTMDWGWGAEKIYTFTFELPPSRLNPVGFYPQPSIIEPTGDVVMEAVKVLIGFADDPTLVLATNLWKLDVELQGDDAARIAWASVRETNPQGWQVLRSTSEDGAYEPVNAEPIAPNQGSYELVDDGLAAGETYYYLVRYEGKADNDVEFGPLSVTTPGGGTDDDDNDDNDDTAGPDDDAGDDDDDDDTGGCS